MLLGIMEYIIYYNLMLRCQRCLKPLENRRIRVLYKHLGVLVEPFTGPRGASQTTLTIALSTRFYPDKGVDDRVVCVCGRGRAKTSGFDVTPLTPSTC